jgi:hypothetical protein
VGDPTLAVIVILLAIAGIACTVIVFLAPAREKLLNDEPAANESRVSSQWAGGADAPTHHFPSHQDNFIHHDFGGGHGGIDGSGPLH